MVRSKILTRSQKKLVIDYLVSQSNSELSPEDWEDFYSSRSSRERALIYNKAKKWARSGSSRSGNAEAHLESQSSEAVDGSSQSIRSMPPPEPSDPFLNNDSDLSLSRNKKPFLAHLEERQLEALKLIAEKTGESRAHHVRAALNRYIQTYIGDFNDYG